MNGARNPCQQGAEAVSKARSRRLSTRAEALLSEYAYTPPCTRGARAPSCCPRDCPRSVISLLLSDASLVAAAAASLTDERLHIHARRLGKSAGDAMRPSAFRQRTPKYVNAALIKTRQFRHIYGLRQSPVRIVRGGEAPNGFLSP